MHNCLSLGFRIANFHGGLVLNVSCRLHTVAGGTGLTCFLYGGIDRYHCGVGVQAIGDIKVEGSGAMREPLVLTQEVLQQRATTLLSRIAELSGLVAGASMGITGCATAQTPRSPDNVEPWPEEVNIIKTDTGRVNLPEELRRSEEDT